MSTQEWYARVERVAPVSPSVDWSCDTEGPFNTKAEAQKRLRYMREAMIRDGLDPRYLLGGVYAHIIHEPINRAEGE